MNLLHKKRIMIEDILPYDCVLLIAGTVHIGVVTGHLI
jgi:hypothetical protein